MTTNLSSNYTVSEIDILTEPWRILLITLAIIITTMGIPGNILTIVAIVNCKSLRTRLNIFIINLCISDVITVGYIYPFMTFDLILGHNPVSLSWCQINMLVWSVLTPTAFVTVMLITISRYLKILHESKFEKVFSKRNTVIMCVLTWVPGVLMAAMTKLSQIEYSRVVRMCLPSSEGSSKTLFFTIPVFTLTYSSSVYCYLRVWRRLQTIEISLRSHGNDVISKMKLDNNRKQTSISFMIFLLYICLTLPMFIVLSSWIDMPNVALTLILFLFFGNSSVNCIVYGAMNKAIRRYFKKALPIFWFNRVHPDSGP